MSPHERAERALALLLRCPEAERVDALQALQRLVQQELVLIWAKTASPGHAWCEAGKRESER